MNEQLLPQQQTSRRTPHSDLDLNLMLTDPVAGRDEITENLRNRLRKTVPRVDSDGRQMYADDGTTPLADTDSLWNKLLYTRDNRLGNLRGEDLEFCEWWLQRCQQCLQNNYIRAAVIALSEAQTVIELSQSRGGFLRKQPNTLRTESVVGDLEPAKKSLMGKKRE